MVARSVDRPESSTIMPLPTKSPTRPAFLARAATNLRGDQGGDVRRRWVPSTRLQTDAKRTESSHSPIAKGIAMYWSISLIVMASLSAPEAQTTYDSYTKAYWQANAVHRPLLVILNPTGENATQPDLITVESLKQDERTRTALNDYIVAVIDTGTDHGKTVHGLFGSPELPRIVVIDERQDKQVFQSSEHLEPTVLATVLEQHRTNPVAPITTISRFHPATPGSFNSFQQEGNCPNCRRN